MHGNIYQLKVSMLFLHRAVLYQYSFRLGTEIEEVGKFDDLVFECAQGSKKAYRFLQAKHKQDEDNKKIEVGGTYLHKIKMVNLGWQSISFLI